MFIDYVENFGAGQIDNKLSFSYAIAKNIQFSYDLTLRYYDSDKVKKMNPATGVEENYPAGMQMLNDMAISLVFNF